MEFRSGSINFPLLRGNGPQQRTAVVHFPREIRRAVAGIVGYSSGFSQNGGDHHLGNIQIRLETAVDGDLANVTATFGLRDWSGTWDDNYEGNVQFVVIAELASISDPTPRGDLVITGIEISQATQHFRSSQHLDGPNVRPDNSILLIARKDTGLRLYVDYDINSGLPPIAQLSGEVTVTTSSNSFSVTPFNAITPRRDSQIQRGQSNHTLNFVIPEAWCVGEILVRCRVFDNANPTQPSRIFERLLRFEDRSPLRLYAVGIHYTGQGLNLAAPTLSQIISTTAFSNLEVVFPAPESYITGYTEIEFSEDMEAQIEDGCGDGYNDLLDELRDLRGDSDDIYYGFLPLGFNGGEVGGCGGGGVAASPFTSFGGLAQECGHAFGRDHAPCDSEMRCGNPSNQDDNYPQYADFASDSIGEYGYNPRTNEVFDPQNTFDFMGYSGPLWVSPYTYNALLNSFPLSDGTSSSFMLQVQGLSNRQNEKSIVQIGREWIRTKRMKLYLAFTINRDKTVILKSSFHYESNHVNPHGRKTPYMVELLDENGEVLTCHQVVCHCKHCGCKDNCYPKDFKAILPYNANASKLIIWQKTEKLIEKDIPKQTSIEVHQKYVVDKKHFQLDWRNFDEEGDNVFWYLVHWQDEDGTWRGLSRRSKNKSCIIPIKLFGRRRTMKARILCSSGIATSCTEIELKLENQVKRSKDPLPIEIDVKENMGLLKAYVIENKNKLVNSPDIIWFDENYSEIGRGSSLHLNRIAKGTQLVRAIYINGGANMKEKSWLINQEKNIDVNYDDLYNSTIKKDK